MAKVLYSQSTNSIHNYPRIDDEPVIGLDPDYLVLTRVYSDPPTPEHNQELWTIDLPTLEYRQSWVIPPTPSIPDWTSFSLTLIPPEIGLQTSFEVWLSQFKPSYQASLTASAGMGDIERTQQAYDTLKAISSTADNNLTLPTPEQVAEWQDTADTYHVPLKF